MTLVVPFLSWYLLNGLVSNEKIVWELYISELIWNVEKGLWFLWVLFLNYLTLWIFKILLKKIVEQSKDFQKSIRGICIVWIIFLLCSDMIINIPILGLQLYQQHCKWFLLGYLLFDNVDYLLKSNVSKLETLISKYIIIFLFLCFVWNWNRVGNLSFVDKIVNESAVGQIVAKGFTHIYRLITAMLGIATAIFVGNDIYNKNGNKNYILYLGRNTLAIYASHLFCLIEGKLFNTEIFNIIGKTTIALVVSIVCMLMIKQSKVASFLFLGKKPK